MPTDDGQAAATVETSRADELSDMEHTMSLFADEYRARMNQADSLGSIAPIWVELTFEVLAGPFAREAAAQTIAAAVASGADPASIPQDAADRLARQHLTGFAMYGELLAAVVASAQQKALTAAGTDNDPALEIAAAGIGTAAAVDPYLTEQRLGVLAERTTVGLRNGATNLAMNTARTFLTATKADTLPLALQPPAPTGTAGSPFDRAKRWLTVLDSRVRRTHSRAHGTTAPTSGVFIIGGSMALYPGDPTLPAKERVNCRCFVVPADADEATWVQRVQGLRTQVVCAGTATSGAGCELPGIGGLAGSGTETASDTGPATLEQRLLDAVTSGDDRRVIPTARPDSVELGTGTHRFREEQSMRAVRAAPPTVADVVVELIDELAADLAGLEDGTLVLVDGIDGLAGIVQETVTEGSVTGLDGEEREATEAEPLVVIQLVVFDEDAGEWTRQDTLAGISANEVTLVDELPTPDMEEDPEPEPEEDDAALAPPADDPDETLNTQRAQAGDFDWEGVLVPEGVESGDRRVIAEGALTWRDLPLTLMAQFQNPESGGHALAVPAGSIWEIDRIGSVVVGRGFFDTGNAGDELRRMMDEGTMKGVSVDIDMVTSEMIDDGDAEIPLMVLLDGRIMGACHDKETEILTESGWKHFAELDQDDRVATQSKTGAFEWQIPTAHTSEPWKGQMIRFASGGQQSGAMTEKSHRQMDMLVTPGHRMLVESTKTGMRSFIAARDLLTKSRRSYRIPMTAQWEADDVTTFRVPWEGRPHAVAGFDGDWFAAFMGAWLSEGYLGSEHSGMIGVAQMPESKGFELFAETFVTDEAPISCSHNGRAFAFNCRPLESYLRQFGTARHKFVPEEVKNFSERQLWIFWHHFMAGDGSADGRRAYTSSPRLADDLQEIAQKLGMWAHITVREPTGSKWIEGREIPVEAQAPQWIVNVRNRPGSRPAACVWDWHGSYVDHDGSDVACVTVPNETIYTRRNGIPVWAGNTATAFPAFQEAILTLVEIDGDQASALVASGQSAWVIDDRYYTTSDNAPDRETA